MIASVLAAALLSMQAAPSSSQSAEPQAKPEEALAAEKVEVAITDKNHPDYVRCKSESVIGSRAKRKRTCMTNREWALVERRGNEQSKEFAGDNFAAGYN